MILFYFFEAKCDQSYYTRFLFFSFDSLWINRNRHCNESVAWFYELRPKQPHYRSKQRFSRPYFNLLWRFDQLLGSGLIFMIFNFLHIIRKSRQIFPDFISGWNLSLTRVHLVSIKTILRPQSYLIIERKIVLYFTIAA